MELSMRKSFTFISSEVSETLASVRKRSIKSASGQRRMTGGADDRNSASVSKTSNRIPETGSPGPNRAQRSVEQSENLSGVQNAQASAASTLDSLRALANNELTKSYPSTNNLLGKEDVLRKRSLDDEQICFCNPYATRSTGEKKIGEMMDYAIQNLNEAGKALTNLGDNFEHDLKLMFMDIMGRVQHWVNVVQNRIYAARADLESMHEESIARKSDQSTKDLELLELRRKLAEAEANLAKEQKIRLENTPDRARNSEMVSTSVQTAIEKERVEQGDKLQSRIAVTLVNTGSQSEDNREKDTTREAELEAELAELVEENERMIKERTEYESAIQCALLKGVSSLNIEALKVLRYPPIPCCASPCRPSTPRSDSPEPVATCRPRARRCDAAVPPQPVQRGSKVPSKNEKIDKMKSKNGARNVSCCQPLLEDLLYCSGSNEICPENSMVFLLHHGDAGNQFQPCIQTRNRPNGNLSNKGSVCVGGKCKKPATTSTKEKVSCATRLLGSRPASYDLYVRNTDDPGENCHGSTARKNANIISKRCDACNGNYRHNKDD